MPKREGTEWPAETISEGLVGRRNGGLPVERGERENCFGIILFDRLESRI